MSWLPKKFPIMNKDRKLRLLFLSHDSSLSGAPLLLLNLIKLIKNKGIYEFSIVVKRGGKLDKVFLDAGDAIILKPENYQANKLLVGKVRDYIHYLFRLNAVIGLTKKSDLIFSNTITNGRLLRKLRGKVPIITYVHELESVMRFFDIHRDTTLALQLSNALCSSTKAVTQNLETNHAVNKDCIFQLNYYFEPISKALLNSKQDIRNSFFQKYNIPPDKFYVVGIGSAVLRKGIDLFIDMCGIVKDKDPGIHFIWIGDFLESDLKVKMEKKVALNNVHSNYTMTGFIPSSPDLLLPFDILALTSREDPYPLVVIEAALLGIPTISFPGTGGMNDFIADDAGFIVDDLSAESMAKKILELKHNSLLIKEKGSNAQLKAAVLHSNANLVLSQLSSAINFVLNS
jgi:glycosyltransferase involved in cell wall biosynthesis